MHIHSINKANPHFREIPTFSNLCFLMYHIITMVIIPVIKIIHFNIIILFWKNDIHKHTKYFWVLVKPLAMLICITNLTVGKSLFDISKVPIFLRSFGLCLLAWFGDDQGKANPTSPFHL